jgi:hypothetical protein
MAGSKRGKSKPDSALLCRLGAQQGKTEISFVQEEILELPSAVKVIRFDPPAADEKGRMTRHSIRDGKVAISQGYPEDRWKRHPWKDFHPVLRDIARKVNRSVRQLRRWIKEGRLKFPPRPKTNKVVTLGECHRQKPAHSD